MPSILFMVFGGISLLYGIYGLVSGGVNSAQMSQMLSDPNLPPGAKDFIRAMAGPGAKVLGLLGMTMSGLLIFGGMQMRNLKNYGVAIAACVLGMLPCTGCCCITLPLGIWTLTILMRPEIKSSFT